MDKEIEKIAEVAAMLWQKNWAECNGGNISVNLTTCIDERISTSGAKTKCIPLQDSYPELANNVFFISGAGKRMRDLAKDPLGCGSIIKINSGGKSYHFLPENAPVPSSEFPSHLAIQRCFKQIGSKNKAVLHTHPTELVALSHCEPFLDAELLTQTLWSMIPEAQIIVPKGIGIVPYELPGSIELAHSTICQLKKYDVVLWEKHGVLSVGEDIIQCFDFIDTLNKSAQIYIFAHSAGFVPQGLNPEQLKGIKDKYC